MKKAKTAKKAKTSKRALPVPAETRELLIRSRLEIAMLPEVRCDGELQHPAGYAIQDAECGYYRTNQSLQSDAAWVMTPQTAYRWATRIEAATAATMYLMDSSNYDRRGGPIEDGGAI